MEISIVKPARILPSGDGKLCVVCAKPRKRVGWTCSDKCRKKHTRLIKSGKKLVRAGVWE